MVIAILFYFLLSFENSLSRAVASMHESRSAGAAVASMYSNTCGWVSTAGAAPGASSSVIVITVASEEDSLRLEGVHKLRDSVESWKNIAIYNTKLYYSANRSWFGAATVTH